MLLIASAHVLTRRADVLMLGWFADTTAAGIYSVAGRSTELVSFTLTAIGVLLWKKLGISRQCPVITLTTGPRSGRRFWPIASKSQAIGAVPLPTPGMCNNQVSFGSPPGLCTCRHPRAMLQSLVEIKPVRM